MVVRIGADPNTNLSHGIAIEGIWTFLDTIPRGVVPKCVMLKDGFGGIGAATDTLLNFIRGPGGVRAYRDTGVVEGFPEQILNSGALQDAHPCGIVSEPRRRTRLHA